MALAWEKISLPKVGDMQEFVNFLARAEEDEEHEQSDAGEEGTVYGVNADCPIFPGLFSFCQIYAGASVGVLPSCCTPCIA